MVLESLNFSARTLQLSCYLGLNRFINDQKYHTEETVWKEKVNEKKLRSPFSAETAETAPASADFSRR